MKTFKQYLEEKQFPSPEIIVRHYLSKAIGTEVFFRTPKGKYNLSYATPYLEPDNLRRVDSFEIDEDHDLQQTYEDVIHRYNAQGTTTGMTKDEFEEWFTLENI